MRKIENVRRLLLEYLACAIAALLAEETLIAAYHTYHYQPEWNVFAVHVPFVVALIWPVVIFSAQDIARAFLAPNRKYIPHFTGAIVFFDAALIEPIAVYAGLWSWNDPGLFGVPLIGLCGWAFFAAIVSACRDRIWQLILLPPLAIHALLIVIWWSAIRWITVPIAGEVALAAAFIVAVLASLFIYRRRSSLATRHASLRRAILTRAPSAAFFFALHFMVSGTRGPSLLLWAYSVCFTLPYLTALFVLHRVQNRKEEHPGKKNLCPHLIDSTS
jgi:hypothetical protein